MTGLRVLRSPLLCLSLLASGACAEDPATADATSDETSGDAGDDAADAADTNAGADSGGQESSNGGDGDGAEGGEDGGDGDDGSYPPEVTEYLDLPYPPYNYADPQLPPHFGEDGVPGQDNAPPNNPTTDDGATLGRVLFFDTLLSSNESISCASCHRAEVGFGDDASFSVGFEGGLTGRNSMHLANSGYYIPGRFFWDERAETLEDQVLMPIQDAVEMGLTLDELVDRVQQAPYYPELFSRAFGDPEITSERIAFALAQYVRALLSYRSPYDLGLTEAGNAAQPFANFTTEENEGKALFYSPQGNCAVCHAGTDQPPGPGGPPDLQQAIFMLNGPANNGLDLDTSADEGAGNGAFKAPSLRNIELNPPYMHDGRFETLEEVVEHYDNGVQAHPNLDPRLFAPGTTEPQQLNLSEAQKAAIVAFLRTLTDLEMLVDEKYEDPFGND